MQSLILLVASLAVAQCAIFEVDQCSWGESYWCSKLKVAHECGAVQHCMGTVWKNQEPQTSVDDSDVCQFCETVIDDVRKFIQDQQDQKIIQKYLESACAIIPDQSLADECKTMVDQYLDIVLELISSELDPKTVCSLMGLCSGDAFKDTARHPNSRVPEKPKVDQVEVEPLCTDCKKFFGDIKNFITSSTTEKELEDLIEQNLCTMMGSLEDYCKQMVEAYIPEILDLVTSEFDPAELCGAMGFCSNSSGIVHQLRMSMPLKKKPVAPVKVSVSPQCILCEFIMKEVDSMLDANATKEEIEDALNEVCSMLPDTIKLECEQFVKQYAPAIIAILEQEMDPTVVCTFLGLCSSSTHKPLLKKVANDELCGTCETLIQYLDSLLEENSTIQEIEQLLEKVCSFLPADLKQECNDMVELYGPAIIQLIAQFADPREVCTALGLCNNQTAKVVPMSSLHASNQLLGGKECSWGPSYWCDNMDNAVKCNAVEHCKRHIWQN